MNNKLLNCSDFTIRNGLTEHALTYILPHGQINNFKKLMEESKQDIDDINLFKILNRFTNRERSEDQWRKIFSDCFLKVISGIRLYHACRPTSLDSYLKDGIVKANQENLEKLAREIWLTENTSDTHKSNVENAILEFAKIFTPYEKRVFLIVDERVLLNTASHYLIRGSEYLQAISARMEECNIGIYQDPLRTRGIPTIIFCDVDANLLGNKLEYLWERLISLYLIDILDSNFIDEEIDYTVTMDHVPAKFISGHSHPKKLKDPHNGMRLIEFKDLTCQFCISHN